MGKSILVIDDEEILTQSFANLLEKEGYSVMTASRADDAIIMAEEEDFDLILSDIRMPGMNGVEAVSAIKKVRETRGLGDIPVIFLTGYADEKIEVTAQALKPLAYLSKPFDVIKLLETIKKTLQ